MVKQESGANKSAGSQALTIKAEQNRLRGCGYRNAWQSPGRSLTGQLEASRDDDDVLAVGQQALDPCPAGFLPLVGRGDV